MNKKTFYVTTPIYYVNSEPHVGSAYTTIAADVLARWNKLQKKEVFFLTGTDEHGQKIQEAAKKAKVSPKEFVDNISNKFKEAFNLLNISYDNFIRTTNKNHEKEVKKILNELYQKDLIYKGEYESYYCVGCEQYLTKGDLINNKCPDHNIYPELRKEEAYLFRLSKFQKKLLELIKSKKFEILPEKRNKEIISFIEKGLKDISISRLKEKVHWGVELPFDKNHTCFVWIDAFLNYLTGLKEKNKFDKFWPADVQLMAKDILRVHATIWPALLLATNNKLPKKLVIHGYFTVNGRKMSKSLGNAISPEYLVKKYGEDSLRYFLMRAIPFGEDGDFSEEGVKEKNNELADKLGNLLSRVTTLAEKYGLEKTNQILNNKQRTIKNKIKTADKIQKLGNVGESKIKKEELRGGSHISLFIHKQGETAIEFEFGYSINIFREFLKEIVYRHLDDYELDKALNWIITFIDYCNWYIQNKKPWETKDKKVLYEVLQGIKDSAILLYPFIPKSSGKILKIFNSKISLEDYGKPIKTSKIKKSKLLFEKIK